MKQKGCWPEKILDRLEFRIVKSITGYYNLKYEEANAMIEKYETPDVEFEEMEEKDVIVTSGCTEYVYGDEMVDD